MTPLILLAALVAFGLAASKAQAQPTALPLPPITKPKTKVRIVRPTKVRTVPRPVAVKKAKVNKLANKLALRIAPADDKARQLMANMIKTATSRTAHPTLKQAAKNQIAAIIAKPKTVRVATINRLPQAAKNQIAKAILKADATTKPTPDQAAKALQLWTKNGGNQGTKNNRSEMVRKSQELMGFTGKSADGIIGPKTRQRAKELGFPLYARAYQKPGAVGAMV